MELFYAGGEEDLFIGVVELLEFVEKQFSFPNNAFLYCNEEGGGVPVRMVDFEDNVTPSSNAVLAGIYQEIGLMIDKAKISEKARRMLLTAKKHIIENPFYSSQWMQVWFSEAHGRFQFFFLGKDSGSLLSDFAKYYHPFHLRFLCPTGTSNIPIFEGKKEGAYVCSGKTCLPGLLWS